MRLGITYTPDQAPETLRATALAADAAGLDELWVWEDSFKQGGVSSAAAALAWTPRISVGIGILPAPLRSVALTAMEFAVLDRTFPGRFVGGIGHGVQSWMAQAGVKHASPMTLLEEYAIALRALLAGETVTVEGRYVNLDRVRLDWPPTTPPPLAIGGHGPKTLALAERLGDITVLESLMTDAELADKAAASGSNPVIATVLVATGADAGARIDAYVAATRPDATEPVGVGGDAATIAARIRHMGECGATTVTVQPLPDDDAAALATFIGREVRPLL